MWVLAVSAWILSTPPPPGTVAASFVPFGIGSVTWRLAWSLGCFEAAASYA